MSTLILPPESEFLLDSKPLSFLRRGCSLGQRSSVALTGNGITRMVRKKRVELRKGISSLILFYRQAWQSRRGDWDSGLEEGDLSKCCGGEVDWSSGQQCLPKSTSGQSEKWHIYEASYNDGLVIQLIKSLYYGHYWQSSEQVHKFIHQ